MLLNGNSRRAKASSHSTVLLPLGPQFELVPLTTDDDLAHHQERCSTKNSDNDSNREDDDDEEEEVIDTILRPAARRNQRRRRGQSAVERSIPFSKRLNLQQIIMNGNNRLTTSYQPVVDDTDGNDGGTATAATNPGERTTLVASTARSFHRENLFQRFLIMGGRSSGNSDGQPTTPSATLRNFIIMAILFSANHGCTVACLGLATARLGTIGAWQSGTLYITYTASAVLGATYITKRLGGRNTMTLGMGLYCVYVGCFWVATQFPSIQRAAALFGAAIGGLGGGLIWTAQGSYFTLASESYACQTQQQQEEEEDSTNDPTTTVNAAEASPVLDTGAATSYLAGVFAFIYLAFEVLMRLLSTILAWALSWVTIFAVYTTVAVVSTFGMIFVYNYGSEAVGTASSVPTASSIFYKVTAALHLLWSDPKMKYMIGLNAAFGFAGAFLNSYVNGEVVEMALNDPDGVYVGALSAWLATSAALMSLVFGKTSRKGWVLTTGALCFFGVAFPFLIQPDSSKMGWAVLILVYTLQGTGRATFESTLKATFADYFRYEKEGAFANIILQNGLSSAIGYVLSFRLLCSEESRYCIRFAKDGKFHDVWTFEVLVCVTSLLAIAGYWRASALYHREQQQNRDVAVAELEENGDAVSA